jgi:hypothetical protein
VRRPRLTAAVLVTVALAGCGGTDEDEGEDQPPGTTVKVESSRLTAEERRLVRRSEASIVAYSRRAAVAVTGARSPPSARERGQALQSVDRLLELAAEKPTATVARGVDVRLFTGDLAENLEGANCDPAVIDRIEAGLASLPTP